MGQTLDESEANRIIYDDKHGWNGIVRFGPKADIERWRINVTNDDKRTLREASNCDVCFAPITGRSYF
jgi:hypothetical protein